MIAGLLVLAFGFVIVAPGLSLFPALIGAFVAQWTLKRSQAADEMGERLRTRVCFACGYDCSELEIREHPMCPECGAVRGSTIRTARPT